MAPVFCDPQASSPHDQVILTFGDFMGEPGKMNPIIEAGVKLMNIDTQEGLATQLRGIYDGRYKFARYFGPKAEDEFELYDLHEDPLELVNLAADPSRQALRKELADRLEKAVADEMGPERVRRLKP